MISLMEVVDADDLMIVTDTGVMIKLPVRDIRPIGRNTQGVRVIRLDEGARIASISRAMEEDKAGEEGVMETSEEEGAPEE
jgi:DNA gyrase subunit A